MSGGEEGGIEIPEGVSVTDLFLVQFGNHFALWRVVAPLVPLLSESFPKFCQTEAALLLVQSAQGDNRQACGSESLKVPLRNDSLALPGTSFEGRNETVRGADLVTACLTGSDLCGKQTL